MIAAHTVAQVQAAERALMERLPPGTLMQRAATGLAVACGGVLGRVTGSHVVLLVGAGNNGADALWAGARLARRGAQVTALAVAEPVADAAAALRRAGGRVLPAAAGVPSGADLVVDGLVGLGAAGPLRPAAAALLAATGGAPVVAVDLPSGVVADTGAADGTAGRADVTVTFGTYKPGLLVGEGRVRAGRVSLVDIGLGPYLPSPVLTALEPADVTTGVAPQDGPGLDKYSRGVVGVVAGSEQYPGAAVLCTGAAVRAGAGMVRFAGSPHAAEQVRSRWPEAVVTEASGAGVTAAGRVQAWVVGPGLGTDEVAEAAVEAVLATDVPVLVDADALTICARHPQWLRRRSAATVLTPHDREYERFGRPVGSDRVAAARALAEDLGVVLLLKGAATVVATPAGGVRVNRTGTAVLATAGSGDVLSGGCGALLALTAPQDSAGNADRAALEAASSAAHLHGRAGTLSARGASTSAYAILSAWPDAVREARAAGADAPGRVGP